MPKPKSSSKKKRPSKSEDDPNLLARSVVEAAIREPLRAAVSAARKTKQAATALSRAAAALSRLGAAKGGRARAEKLNADQRKAIALNAAKKRWHHPTD